MSWTSKLKLLAVGILLGSCGTGPTPDAQTTPAYASTESLIEVEALAERLTRAHGFKLVDMRRPEEYERGHLPAAVNIWRSDITDTLYPYGGMMPAQVQLEHLLQSRGIDPSDTIVVYDNNAQCDAARLWWVLRFYGHRNVKLLNGGLRAWQADRSAVTSVPPTIEPSSYRFSGQRDSSMLIPYQQMSSVIGDTNMVILDTRSTDEYTGAKHKAGAAYAGHIHGAINIDWARSVDYQGTHRFLEAGQLKQQFDQQGIDGSRPVITYCHSGVRSSHTFFVLTELLGYRNIKNYDGSWVEWSHLQKP